MKTKVLFEMVSTQSKSEIMGPLLLLLECKVRVTSPMSRELHRHESHVRQSDLKTVFSKYMVLGIFTELSEY